MLHKGERTAVIKGLDNGEIVLTKLPPAAFEGMKVNVYTETAAQ